MIGLACVLFLDVAALGAVAWWLFALLVVAWVAMFVVACAWWTPRPRWIPWLAVVGLVLWVGVVIGGSASGL